MSSLRKYHFIFVSSIFLLFLIGLINCGKKQNIVPTPIDSVSIFKDIKLVTDSVRIKLNQGDSVVLQTNKGPLKLILLSAVKPCPLMSCGICDLSAEIRVKLILNSISYTPKTRDIFETIDCLRKDLPIYTSTDCSQIFNKLYWLPTESMLFRIRYFAPYPETLNEVYETYNNKLFQIDLNIQNSCRI